MTLDKPEQPVWLQSTAANHEYDNFDKDSSLVLSYWNPGVLPAKKKPKVIALKSKKSKSSILSRKSWKSSVISRKSKDQLPVIPPEKLESDRTEWRASQWSHNPWADKTIKVHPMGRAPTIVGDKVKIAPKDSLMSEIMESDLHATPVNDRNAAIPEPQAKLSKISSERFSW